MQATTPEDNSFFPREKEELPQAGLEPVTFCILGRPLYQLNHQGSSPGQAESLKFVQGKWRLSPDKQGYSTSALIHISQHCTHFRCSCATHASSLSFNWSSASAKFTTVSPGGMRSTGGEGQATISVHIHVHVHE